MSISLPVVKYLGITDYQPVWQSMKLFTQERTENTADELWVTEHYPVYTQGLNGRREHVINPGEIPMVKVDRGGQVTYHGPGQLVIYCLLDLTRLGLGIRQLVTAIEQSIVQLLKAYNIDAYAKKEAPGVYVNEAKIAALGLRVRKGRCYHGLSLNLDMDLKPFSGIDPCGYRDLEVIQLADLVKDFSTEQVQQQLCSILMNEIGYE